MAPLWPVHVFMGKWLIFPAKQLNFSERQKNVHFFFFRGGRYCLKIHTVVCAQEFCEHLLLPELSQWFPAPRAQPRVHQKQLCRVGNNENEAERSCASCNVMVAGPGINLDLLAPYLVISLLDVFPFSFENVDSLLERKIYKHYTFHCQKRGFVIWYRNSFNYWGNFTAWGHKGQIC